MPTPAIFAWPVAHKNACWGAPQTRRTSGQSVQKSSAAHKIPQSIFHPIQALQQPAPDGWEPEGRNQERQHKEHYAAQRLTTDEQDKSRQDQYYAAYMTQCRSYAVEKRHDGNEQDQSYHKGGGKDFENDHISYLP